MSLKFLYLGVCPDADPTKHRAVIDTPKYQLIVNLVATKDEGVEIARKLAREGELLAVGLCSGFGFEGASKVREAVGQVPVSLEFFQVPDAVNLSKKLEKLGMTQA